MFDDATIAAATATAERLKVPRAALLAVAEVESNGKVFARVKGRDEPLIRFEGHYFDRRLKGAARALARAQGLASPRAGAVKNPASQAKRWAMLERARAIDAQAADESVSWGLGQVMGAHWKPLDFVSVGALVTLARRDAAGQIELMARFIEENGLVDELQRLDFTAFARGYNGKGFRKNAYHTKMAAAYRRWAGDAAESVATGMLRMGSTGARVRELQVLLGRAGFKVEVDGDFGPATKAALVAFQKKQKIKADGVAGPQTMQALEKWRQGPKDQPGEQPIGEVPEVKEAVRSGGALALLVALRDQAAEAAAQLTGLDVATATTAANWLAAGAGVLGVGLAAWAVWGAIKARRTDEGDVDGEAGWWERVRSLLPHAPKALRRGVA